MVPHQRALGLALANGLGQYVSPIKIRSILLESQRHGKACLFVIIPLRQSRFRRALQHYGESLLP
jgi:hypothetical protein